MRNIIDCLYAGIVDLTLDGIVIDANLACAELAGVERNAMPGRAFADFFSLKFAEGQGDWASLMADCRQGGVRREQVMVERVDHRSVTLDIQLAPCYEQGTIRSLVASMVEITAEVEATQRAKQIEERYRIATTAAKIGVWEWDILDDSVEWCDTTLLIHGFTRKEFENKREIFWDVYHPDDVRAFEETLRRALDRGTNFEASVRIIRHNDREVRWIHTRAEVVRDAKGEATKLIGTVMDVTDRMAAEAERQHLLEAERAARSEAERQSHLKDEFLSMLSHELRTPLTAVIGWSQLLQSGQRTIEEYMDGFAVIERSARAQAQIIGDLLDTNRMASGKVRIEPREMDLVDVISDAIQSIQTAAEAKQIHIEWSHPESAWMVGDDTRLQQVAWNLLSNAIKFSLPEARIEVTLLQEANNWRLDVRDFGEGIAEDFLPHVFERFRQAGTAAAKKSGGLGLGLSIARQLVELHGGRISVESAPGHGATFTVILPIRRLKAEPLHPADDALTLDGLTVAILDDDIDTLNLLVRLLTEAGAEVVPARRLADLRAHLSSQPVNVILSDISMPDEDGYTIIRAIRELPKDRGGETPAIALTAFSRDADRAHALDAGFQLHLSKPIDSPTLIQAIRSVVSPRAAEKIH